MLFRSVEVEAGSEVRITGQKKVFDDNVLVQSGFSVETVKGQVNCAVVEGYGSKIKAEVKSSAGTEVFESKGEGAKQAKADKS